MTAETNMICLWRHRETSNNSRKTNIFSGNLCFWSSYNFINRKLWQIWERMRADKSRRSVCDRFFENIEYGISISQRTWNGHLIIWDKYLPTKHWVILMFIESLKLWKFEASKIWNQETKSPRNQETNRVLYFQVRESTPPLNTPTPTPAPAPRPHTLPTRPSASLSIGCLIGILFNDQSKGRPKADSKCGQFYMSALASQEMHGELL